MFGSLALSSLGLQPSVMPSFISAFVAWVVLRFLLPGYEADEAPGDARPEFALPSIFPAPVRCAQSAVAGTRNRSSHVPQPHRANLWLCCIRHCRAMECIPAQTVVALVPVGWERGDAGQWGHGTVTLGLVTAQSHVDSLALRSQRPRAVLRRTPWRSGAGRRVMWGGIHPRFSYPCATGAGNERWRSLTASWQRWRKMKTSHWTLMRTSRVRCSVRRA